MYTTNHRIKVKFRTASSSPECHKKVSIFKCAQKSIKLDIEADLSSSLMTGNKYYYQSVLRPLHQTEIRYPSTNIKSSRSSKQSRYAHINDGARKAVIIRKAQNYNMILAILISFHIFCSSQSILVEEPNINRNDELNPLSVRTLNGTSFGNTGKSTLSNSTGNSVLVSSSVAASGGGYLEKLDNLERSVAAVLIKVAYGTTSTTKRSIPDNSYVLGLTTAATPLLTTLRYHQLVHHAQHNSGRHRNYELDLERDHALPTSAPNADILKSNNNPTYPNPNRHHSSSSNSHDRDRQRHPPMQYNSTPMPLIPNLLKKSNGQPTIPMYPGDIPSYSPPSRSFFTPPLPPEYQNPFADKPTLRGTNNEGIISNTVVFNSRRPIPPPSLMPGHERIPLRPPDLATFIGGNASGNDGNESDSVGAVEKQIPLQGGSIKKALNTPSRSNDAVGILAAETALPDDYNMNNNNDHGTPDLISPAAGSVKRQKEVLPNIRRILGSNGKKGDIPAVLLRHVTQRPFVSSMQQTPAVPKVLVESAIDSASSQESSSNSSSNSNTNANINKSRQSQLDLNDIPAINSVSQQQSVTTTPSAAAALDEAAATSSATHAFTTSAEQATLPTTNGSEKVAAAAAHSPWIWAWNIHIYLCVVLFTILSVYSLYKLVTYNKLTHLFAQSYFVYIHLILILICIMRIIYLCIDAYNIHSTFPIFAAELLFNLPSTFLTVAFAVLILFLFLKSLNHKNNRYSALVRPLTVVVGCGVHVGLCITLHYVESYTLHNHQLYSQQQQQQHYFRRQQQQQQTQHLLSTSLANPPPPPRVLSLICQIIYIFICLSLGLLYLYLYRILKRILKSKSQNYIHGYQNLSYAIHITIATALLFVLLAALQIFGAVCISTTTRPLMSQTNIVDVDWLQWGYQFSLRLIEIAIITLISWVTGLRTSIGIGNNVNNAVAVNSDVRMVGPVVGGREKHPTTTTPGTLQNSSHTNMANFFLPCTSSSSQEQFETDYPAICNTNTNLHTYTMRTGKLIYDDSYALNSLTTAGRGAASPVGAGTEYQLQEPMYQRPYDTGSIRSAVNHNLTSRLNPHHHHHHHLHQLRGAAFMSNDYMTDDATIDHYENPNFDLRTSSAGAVGALQKLGSGSGSGSGTGSGTGSGSSQQQMLLLQSDSCYSEPLQENSSYEFNNFERPVFKEREKTLTVRDELWPECQQQQHRVQASDRRTSSNSTTNSCTSSNGGRHANYNSYDRGGGNYNGVRKSGTLNSINNGGGGVLGSVIVGSGTGPDFNRTINNVTMPGGNIRLNGAQTLAHSTERSYFQRTSGRTNNNMNFGNRSFATTNNFELESRKQQQHQQNKQHQRQKQYNRRNSDDEDEDEEEDEDDMITGCNVECTNLISNDVVDENSCITSDNSSINITNSHQNVQTKNIITVPQQFQQEMNASSIPDHSVNDSVIATSALDVSPSGFVPRYRANNDDHQIGNVSEHQQQNCKILTKNCKNINGIDC